MENSNEINEALKKELLDNWDLVEHLAPEQGFDPKDEDFKEKLISAYTKTADKMTMHGPKDKIKASLETVKRTDNFNPAPDDLGEVGKEEGNQNKEDKSEGRANNYGKVL